MDERYRFETNKLLTYLEEAWAVVERRRLTEEQADRLAKLLRDAQIGVINSYRDLHGPVQLPYDWEAYPKGRKRARNPDLDDIPPKRPSDG